LKAYTAGKIFTGDKWLEDHAVIVKDDRITDILPTAKLSSEFPLEKFENCFLIPAFIDLQIYGAHGKLLAVNRDPSCLKEIVDYSIAGGACHCMPTVATNSKEVFYQCIDAVRSYWNNGSEGVLGLHLEGPWINAEKKGAHVSSLIHSPQLNEVKEMLDYGNGIINMITLAPEVCDEKIIRLIGEYDITISAGHSNATYAEAKKSFIAGISAVTHLFNAMSQLLHREPGLAGAAMDDDSVMSSIIPDGYHVDYAALRIAKKVMKERLFAITDAVTTTSEGYYQHTLAGDKYEANGVLSGSALTMIRAVQNLVKYGGIEIGEAIRMCSLYPARLMKIDDLLGSIAAGKKAKMLVLNESLEIIQTLC